MDYFNIILVLVGIALAVLVFYLAKKKCKEKEIPELIRQQAEKKQASKNRILEEISLKSSITNDDVEKLVEVSDATATRYLDELEKEGKIRQVGERGGYVYYEKI